MIRTGKCVSDAWELVNRDLGYHILLAFLWQLGYLLTLGILTPPLTCGYVGIIMKQMRDPNYRIAVGDLGEGFRHFGQSFLCWLLYWAVVMVLAGIMGTGVYLLFLTLVLYFQGFLLFMVMEIALIVGLAGLYFSFILIVDRGQPCWPAVQWTTRTIGAHFWDFVALVGVLTLINYLGGLACGVGWLLTFPLFLAGLVFLTYLLARKYHLHLLFHLCLSIQFAAELAAAVWCAQ